MERVPDLVDAIIRYLENQNAPGGHSSFTLTEIVAIVVAILALVGVIINTVVTVNSNRRLQKSSARIEWIQKVREHTSLLVSNYYSILQISNIDEKKALLLKAKEYTNRLILFFGPETHAERSILCEDNNDGKNEGICKRLKSVCRDYEHFILNIMNQREALPEKKPKKEVFNEDESTSYIGYFEASKQLEEELDEIITIFRIYLKNEWIKAKKGR